VYGPVPTGFGFVSVTGSATSAQMCSGTMNLPSTLSCLTKTEFSKAIVTWSPSTVTSVMPSAAVSMPGLSRSSSNVKAMSSAVNSSPSFQVTPSRAVTVTDL
jgi:hypothetical protein